MKAAERNIKNRNLRRRFAEEDFYRECVEFRTDLRMVSTVLKTMFLKKYTTLDSFLDVLSLNNSGRPDGACDAIDDVLFNTMIVLYQNVTVSKRRCMPPRL